MMKGEKMSIRVHGNPLPFAVGESLVNWVTVLQGERKGKALSVHQYYGDLLSPISKAVPNNGFGASCIYGIDGYNDPIDDDANDGGDDGREGDGSYLSAARGKAKRIGGTSEEAEAARVATAVEETVTAPSAVEETVFAGEFIRLYDYTAWCLAAH
jgi:hypothetical protein